MSVVDRVYATALFEAARGHDRLEPVRNELQQVVAAEAEVPELRESGGRFDLAKPSGEAAMLRRLRLLDGPGSVGYAGSFARA